MGDGGLHASPPPRHCALRPTNCIEPFHSQLQEESFSSTWRDTRNSQTSGSPKRASTAIMARSPCVTRLSIWQSSALRKLLKHIHSLQHDLAHDFMTTNTRTLAINTTSRSIIHQLTQRTEKRTRITATQQCLTCGAMRHRERQHDPANTTTLERRIPRPTGEWRPRPKESKDRRSSP